MSSFFAPFFFFKPRSSVGFHPTGSDRNAAGKLVQDPSERLRRVYWRFG